MDDDGGVTAALKRGLTFEGYAVEVAASGESGLRLLRGQTPDLVILDVMMPGVDGLEVLRRLRAAGDDTPVLLLTARDEDRDQIAGLEAGADDYVVKPFTFDVLLARVRTLLRRRRTERPTVLRCADLTLEVEGHVVRRGGRVVPLTHLEFRLLRELLEGQGRVLSKQRLLDRVWDKSYFGDVNVVEVCVKQLRHKLEEPGEERLIHTVRGAGYVLRRE
ncbi:MAG: response regulator transcription factor [Deinococcota bacterium]